MLDASGKKFKIYKQVKYKDTHICKEMDKSISHVDMQGMALKLVKILTIIFSLLEWDDGEFFTLLNVILKTFAVIMIIDFKF